DEGDGGTSGGQGEGDPAGLILSVIGDKHDYDTDDWIIAAQVICPPPPGTRERGDICEVVTAVAPGIAPIKIHFDNARHVNGKQRAWVACCGKHHPACFKWRTVELEPNRQTLLARLAAWAWRGHESQQPAQVKFQHTKHVVSQAEMD
ncbi:unnamed protein product, partial [Prorocentrum cordatum]